MPTGFFGKLPYSGDFVARGLSVGVRPILDRWLTTNLARASQDADDWPSPGLIALIPGGTSALLLAIIPSHDAPGRFFPLAACLPVNKTTKKSAESWSDQVFKVLTNTVTNHISPDELCAALADISAPEPDLQSPLNTNTIWVPGQEFVSSPTAVFSKK